MALTFGIGTRVRVLPRLLFCLHVLLLFGRGRMYGGRLLHVGAVSLLLSRRRIPRAVWGDAILLLDRRIGRRVRPVLRRPIKVFWL